MTDTVMNEYTYIGNWKWMAVDWNLSSKVTHPNKDEHKFSSCHQVK